MIAAVVVTYSAPAGMLDRCVASLRAAGGVDRVIVVDTGSRAAPADTAVEVVRVANRGYGAAANVGFARASGATAVALLNDDIEVAPGWIPPLVAELAGDRVGAAQPALVVAGSDPPLVDSLGVRLGPDGAGTGVGGGDPYAPAPPSDLDVFTGGAVLFAPAFLAATGGFDERWFLYYEDVDLAMRGRELGWRYRLAPASVVRHHGGTTTGADPAGTRFHQERNRLWAAFRFAPPATVARAIWLSLRRLRYEPRGVHARALAAGLAGAPVRLVERRRVVTRRRAG